MSFEDYLKEKVNDLSPQYLTLFAGLICERLYQNYLFFSLKEEWGDIEILDESLIIIYQFVNNGNINKKEVKQLIKSVEKISPDLDKFTESASYALDTCSAFIEALEYLLDRETEHILNISMASTDSVDMFIQELENFNSDANIDYLILNHNSMKSELAYQKIIIDKLIKSKVIVNHDIKELRQLSKVNQSINLNLIY